ncbi:hybrid sensor histidine kinase/response regulator transcription factor [uncultured Winogradskyella sp.]|uniref:hybrid sensor histidine kinase/response regulator transcription factor n=1 Tax=uncultured Winogradskyella sp. TaxID=395353 RepID=UPI002622F36B|nr:hybrid sensor histidine kinase/response regulator transcription factor [uncultured Winogradskyella sp.]
MIRAFYIGVLTFALMSNVYAQNSNYKFKQISTSEGLSQSSVIAIHQDKIGQMWFGTRDGLNKYDGSNFTLYRNINNDSLSISNNDILSIKDDSEGFIWIGTYNGLNRYNPIQNNFTRYYRNSNNNSLRSNTVWCLEEIENEIWVGTTNGLSIYDKSKDQFNTIVYPDNETVNLSNTFITKILKTKKGDVWVATTKGLHKLLKRDANDFYFKSYHLQSVAKEPKSELMIQDILESKNGKIWVATKNEGILFYNYKTDALEKLNNKAFKELESNDFRALSIDKKGNLWMGANDGIYIYDSNKEVKLLSGQQNISKVKSLYTDSSGSMWVGTYYGGLSLWDEHNLNFANLHYNDIGKTLNYNVVSCIVTDNKQNVYLGTEGGGITILDSLNNRKNVINQDIFKGLKSDNVKSLLFLEKDYLLIGTFGNGLTILDLKSNKIVENYIPNKLYKLIENESVYCIKKGYDNTIWLGTFGQGLIKLNIEDKSFKVFKNKSNDLESLTSNRVRAILVDSKKRVWVGTQKGLNLMSGSSQFNSNSISHFFFNENTNSGDDILTIYEDSHNTIWVGTKAQGLFKYNGSNFNRVKIINKDNKVEIKSIHSIVEDDNNNLWLGSNQGIAKFEIKSNKTVIYNQTDGLLGKEFNDNAVLKIAANKFYFGGPSGVTYFEANKIHINENSPQVILTDFKIKNKSVSIEDNGILKKHISFTKSISLTYDNANFSINFSIPNFINSDNNLYSYRLIGVQDDWLTTKKNEAFYTIQKPGTYVFEVKGANNDVVWNERPTKLEIIVSPAPWRSWWAFTIYVLLIVASLMILMWFLKSRTKLKHELELEHVESERNEELNQAKLEFFTNISHEFRTPLTLILGPLQQILNDYRGSNKMHKKLLVIENNANHLLHLINRLMNFRKLENNQSKLQAAEGNIVKFLKEIYFSFTEHAKNGGYEYTIDTNSEEIFVFYDRVKLERVFYNLLSNAFRYTKKGGIIKLNILKQNNQLVVEVEDNGVGISEEYIEKIFDRFFEVPIHNEPQKNYNKGSGIGLSIAKNIVKLHKGTITVKNKVNGGVVFKVELPLGRLHLSDDEIISDFKISDDISQYKPQLSQLEISLDDSIDDQIIDANKLTLLIVEDHEPLRSFIKKLLKKDYNVLEAENGEVAMKKALEAIPDLIVSDVVMPVMVGTELCAKIKSNIKTSHIPVILLTSRTSLIYRLEGLESGADEYISKPFNIKEFLLKINNILDSSERLKDKFSSEDYLTPSEITMSSMDEKLLKKAFDIVNKNISNEQFDISTFCSELGVSRTMLFTKIKAWANVTPNEFIQITRMKRAAQLLEHNKLNISQICYKVGFKNPKYFSKTFQKRYGLTPTDYRNKFFDDNLD